MMEHDRIRLDLCCAARLLYRNGLSAANAGHISVAIGEGRMLVNHFGPSLATLMPRDIVILPNHGAITTADNIPLALVRMLLLEGMVQRNLSVAQVARANGLRAIPIAPEAARRAKSEIARIPAIAPLGQDFLPRLQKSDPDLFAGNA